MQFPNSSFSLQRPAIAVETTAGGSLAGNVSSSACWSCSSKVSGASERPAVRRAERFSDLVSFLLIGRHLNFDQSAQLTASTEVPGPLLRYDCPTLVESFLPSSSASSL